MRAYLATREVFGHVALWQQIEALDNQVDDACSRQMLNDLRAAEQPRHHLVPALAAPGRADGAAVRALQPAVEALRTGWQRAARVAARRGWGRAGVPLALAHAWPRRRPVRRARRRRGRRGDARPLDRSRSARGSGRAWAWPLRQQIDALPADSHWQSLAKIALGDDLAGLQRAIAQDVLAAAKAARRKRWPLGTAQRRGAGPRRRLLAELGDAKSADLAMLSVALRELRNLA